jgi:hypothetical protein
LKTPKTETVRVTVSENNRSFFYGPQYIPPIIISKVEFSPVVLEMMSAIGYEREK